VPITFADPIRGEGKLVFAEGAQVRIGGALFASQPLGKPIELARVGAIEGEPALPVDWKQTQVGNADGTVSLFAKPTKGLILLFR